MNYTPSIEFSSVSEIEKLQSEKLVSLLKYTSEKSPFYKKLFRQSNIDVTSIKTIHDLIKIPVTTKNDLQLFNWDFLCIDKKEIAEFTSTSGTLGKPVTIALSANDLERLAYNEAISFTCADGSAKDLYQLMLTLDRQFMAGIAYYEGIRRLGAGLVRVGPGLPAMQWETIQRLNPTVLVGVPSFVVKLIEYGNEIKIDFNSTSVEKIICIGESIRYADFRPNVLAQRIASSWDVQLYSTYASTEMQTAFTECHYSQGGHLHPELLIIELLDDNNDPVKDGEQGEVTITTLGVEAMPLVRYKTGDVAVAHRAVCACGRTTLRLGPVTGRKQQMLKLKGTTVYPPIIFDILNQQPAIQDYVIEALTGELGTDEIKIHLSAGMQDGKDLLPGLEATFQSRLRVTPIIELVNPVKLEKLRGEGRKVQRFIDSRVNL
ncbi:MAG: AMP-binding protein [Cyclobacteriaceae bacterium]|nr:AMP-binding protein [Cyclobacteriaceae bacterium]